MAQPTLTPREFARNWGDNATKESAAAKEHFIDLCRMLGEPTPNGADRTGTTYAFEKAVRKVAGGDGFADVWKKDFFGWEYKGKGKDLKAAYLQQSPAAQAAIDNYIERLAIFGPALGFPSTSQVDGELRELRPDLGSVHFRLLYRRSDNIFVILHAFIKPGSSIARSDIEIAHRRWADLKARMDVVPRRPPRAIGHDATNG